MTADTPASVQRVRRRGWLLAIGGLTASGVGALFGSVLAAVPLVIASGTLVTVLLMTREASDG